MNQTKLIPIGKAAQLIGVSIATLRRWDKNGKLPSLRPMPTGNRYYRREEIESFLGQRLDIIAKNWARAKEAVSPDDEYYCQTKDVFDARLTRLQNNLGKTIDPGRVSLIVSAAGEIGNNSFDHNLGMWPDITGIFFGWDIIKRQVVLADRGQGILETLRRVRPALKNHSEALNVAFTEIISGRAPEARGNGLKYVRKVITENSMSLWFASGDGELSIERGAQNLCVETGRPTFHGCVAIIFF